MRICIEVSVYGLASPKGDVVQVDDIVVSAAIDEGTKLAITNRQRFFEISGWLVVLQHHWCLGGLCRCRQAEKGGNEQISLHIHCFLEFRLQRYKKIDH